jgi:hypothetical protein
MAAGDHDFDASARPSEVMAAAIAGTLGDSDHSASHRRYLEGAARIERLVDSGARIDAVLALIALELPQWQLRRIIYDGGEWHCALSRTRELADWLDQSAEGRHADLALALLDAFADAQRIAASSRQPRVLPRPTDATCELLCCDNFC